MSEIKASIKEFPLQPNALFGLGVRALSRGEIDQAIQIGTKLVNEDYEHGNVLLGAAYEKLGDITSEVKNYETAMFYYTRAVDLVGALEAWLALGRFFYLGKGVEKDLVKASDYYLTILRDVDNPIAHLVLGKMYLDGEGVEPNIDLAKYHLSCAASRGYVFAFSYLGTVFFRVNKPMLGIAYRLKSIAMIISTKIGLEKFSLRRI